ncbi:MAG: redoxin domain-containing protein [Rhizobiales bacterium]|nr:redoxin domain-containing protein [Hyphomicrobiales bacterium]
MITEGQKVPKFEVSTDDGGKISSKSLAGRPAVLYFYPKDDTSGCTKQALAFTELAERFAAIGVPVIGISPDSLASHEKFRKKHNLAVGLASDEDKSLAEAFGVWVEKSMYGRKYMGIERSTFLIDAKGKVARVWRKVKVPGHAEEVLAAASELAG